MFSDDKEALDYLYSLGWQQKSGMLIAPKLTNVSTLEWEAVNYLWLEWDYGYDPDVK